MVTSDAGRAKCRKVLSHFRAEELETGSGLHHSSTSALPAVPLVLHELVNGSEADEQVHEPLYCRPRPEDHTDNIPVGAKKTAETDKAPVYSPHDEEDERDYVQIFHIDR